MGKHNRPYLIPDTDPMKGQNVLELFKQEFPTADITSNPMENNKGEIYGHEYKVTIKPGFAQYGFCLYPDDIVYSVARYQYKGPNDPPYNYDVWIATCLETVPELRRDFNIIREMLKQGRYLTVLEEYNINCASLRKESK